MIDVPTCEPGPATTCHRSFGKPASSSSCGREQRGQHGLGVGLGDDGVAGQQRGQPVAERHRERVVPRRDDPDDALGHPVDLDPGQPGDDAELALGVEVLVGGAGVVARGERDVHGLVEGVLAGLAGLPHDQVDDLVLAVEHEVVQAQQDPGPLVERGARPGRLGALGPGERLGDVVVGRLRDVRERLAVERRADRDGLAGAGRDPAGQRRDVLGLEGVRRGRVVLGIGRSVDQGSACGVLRAHVTEAM